MGMDVYGKNATSEAGKYFRRNIFGWPPLWGYCEYLAPELTSKVKYGYTNDGDGLNAEDSKALGEMLIKHAKQMETLPAAPGERPLEARDLQEFGKFLVDCGGFEIW